MQLPRALSPLSYPAYRDVFWGSALSNVGTWMHRVAVDWLVYQQTDSVAMVGVVSFAQFVPLAVAGPFAGVLADRFNRRNLLVGAQAWMMATAAVLAALEAAGRATPLALVLASLALGIGFAFAAPAWQSMVPRLVPRERLTSAIALNSSKRSAARIAGPAVGGVLLATIGAGGVFLINTLSYVAAIVAIWRLGDLGTVEPDGTRVREQLAAGLRYARADRTIFWLISGVMLLGLLATPLVTLLPVYARDVLHGDATTLGFLTASLGAGSLLGTLLLAQFGDHVGPPLLVGGSVLALSLATAGVAAATGLALMAAAVLASGLFRLGSIAAVNTRLQARADDAYRGRVMSLFMVSFGAAYPVGALVIGAGAQAFGVRTVTMAMAVGIAMVGLLLRHKLTLHTVAPRRPVDPGDAEVEAEVAGLPGVNDGA